MSWLNWMAGWFVAYSIGWTAHWLNWRAGWFVSERLRDIEIEEGVVWSEG